MKSFLSITLLSILAIASIIYYRIQYVENKEIEKRKEVSVGTYELNIEESNLGIHVNDTLLFKNLKLHLNSDYTFNFSQSVPFIYDSLGTWRVASVGIYGSNELIYINKFSNQISSCCYENKIQIKSPIGKKGVAQAELLVFNKIS